MIGELRDLETISAAVTAAETGHLVLTTLHTPDAPQSIDRIIDVFPSGQQQQIRIQLSSILIGILSQQLVPLVTETGRMVATELLIANNAVKNYIREAKTSQIKNAIQTGSALGMHTMDQDLARMYREGLIIEKCDRLAYDLKDLEDSGRLDPEGVLCYRNTGGLFYCRDSYRYFRMFFRARLCRKNTI